LGYLENEIEHEFAYDMMDQLVSESGFQPHRYQYDSLFNRKIKDEAQYEHDALNQIVDDSLVSYDRNGNALEYQGIKCVYDALDRLTCVETPKGTYCYEYDAFHRRTTRLSPDGQRTSFIYTGENEIGAVVNGKMTQLRVLGLGRGAEIGAAVMMVLNGKTYGVVHNHMGSVAALFDPISGEGVEEYSYSAFGEEVVRNHLSPWRFSSKRFDEETGWSYFGRRYYVAELGRWLTTDPLGYDAGPNLYAYVSNNPLWLIDLYGLYEYEPDPYYMALMWENRRQFINFREDNIPYYFNLGREEKVENARVFLCCGIMNSRETIEETAKMVSDYYGGTNVHVLAWPSAGFASDLMDVQNGMWTAPTTQEFLAREIITNLYKEIKHYEDPRVFNNLHSGGGQLAGQAISSFDKTVQAAMDVRTFGSALIMDMRPYADGKNYIQWVDYVSYITQGNYIPYYYHQGSVEFLMPRSFDPHAIMGGAYENQIRELGKKFKSKYGLE
jgi:RHS repeat-associated protein